MDNEREWLKSELIEIEKSQYNVDDAQRRWDILTLMLRHIGDPEPEFRDDLICNTLYDWIDNKGYFSQEQLKKVLSVLTDGEHLFHRIGSDGEDSVFTRTFSVLGVALILKSHRKKPFFNAEELFAVKDKLIGYYTSESDFRGYVPGQGWAHGAAHGADALDELAQCTENGESVLQEILDAFKKVLANGSYIFHNEEDERIARVIFRIMKENRFSKQAMVSWLEELGDSAQGPGGRAQYVARVNTKNCVRSLYFKAIYYNHAWDMIDTIIEAEKKLNRFYEVDRELIEGNR